MYCRTKRQNNGSKGAVRRVVSGGGLCHSVPPCDPNKFIISHSVICLTNKPKT